MRDMIWNAVRSKVSEGMILPWWALVVRAVLSPLEFFYWRMSQQTGYQWQNDENWKTMLDEALKENGESWGDVEANTMTEEDMEKKFDSGYGGTEGCPFTVWTKNRVYFPICHDGAEWVGSVSRHSDA